MVVCAFQKDKAPATAGNVESTRRRCACVAGAFADAAAHESWVASGADGRRMKRKGGSREGPCDDAVVVGIRRCWEKSEIRNGTRNMESKFCSVRLEITDREFCGEMSCCGLRDEAVIVMWNPALMSEA